MKTIHVEISQTLELPDEVEIISVLGSRAIKIGEEIIVPRVNYFSVKQIDSNHFQYFEPQEETYDIIMVSLSHDSTEINNL